jgi:hypothetical protein
VRLAAGPCSTNIQQSSAHGVAVVHEVHQQVAYKWRQVEEGGGGGGRQTEPSSCRCVGVCGEGGAVHPASMHHTICLSYCETQAAVQQQAVCLMLNPCAALSLLPCCVSVEYLACTLAAAPCPTKDRLKSPLATPLFQKNQLTWLLAPAPAAAPDPAGRPPAGKVPGGCTWTRL